MRRVDAGTAGCRLQAWWEGTWCDPDVVRSGSQPVTSQAADLPDPGGQSCPLQETWDGLPAGPAQGCCCRYPLSTLTESVMMACHDGAGGGR